MSNIYIMVLNNPLFKNLSDKDQRAMAKLIYKAEMIEMHARDRAVVRTNESFQRIIDALNGAIIAEFPPSTFDDDVDFDEEEDPFK